MLLPRALDMVEAGSAMPLPVAKPNIPEVEVKQESEQSRSTRRKRARTKLGEGNCAGRSDLCDGGRDHEGG